LTEIDRKQDRAPVPTDWTYAPAPESRDIVRIAERYGHFIGGEWIEASSTYPTIAPRDEEVLAEIGEGTEQDLLDVVEQIIPSIRFRHAHDPSHAWSHMAASLLGPALTLPVTDGRLALGTWQSVLLVELDGPRERTVYVTLLAV